MTLMSMKKSEKRGSDVVEEERIRKWKTLTNTV